ncbi:unnamed protein product [Mortierella alpina]
MFFRKEAQAPFARYHSQVQEVITALGECVVRLVKDIALPSAFPQALQQTSRLRNLTLLRYLSMESSTEADLELYSTTILSLLDASPAIQVLHLSRFACRSDTLVLRLAKIIRTKGRRLKQLRIDGLDNCVEGTVFHTLLWSCAAVEELRVGFGPSPHSTTSSFPKSLHEFKALAREALFSSVSGLDSPQADVTEMTAYSPESDRIELAWRELGQGVWLIYPDFELIRELLPMCPFLESLTIPQLSERDIIKFLAPVLASTMPLLRHLDLSNLSHQSVWTCRLVQACKDLKSLHLGSPQFESPLLMNAVLSGYSHSLQALRINASARLSSQQLVLILNSFPRLRSLHALSRANNMLLANTAEWQTPAGWYTPPIRLVLKTSDMATEPEQSGWNCKELETLHLCYSSEDRFIGIPEVLWRQIGQLSKLKDMKLHRQASLSVLDAQEKESVRQAVFSWMGLPHLRRLELRGLNAFMDESHQFHNAFQHSLYTCISLQRGPNLNVSSSKEAQAAFARHHSHIQEVSTASGDFVVFLAGSIGLSSTPSQDLGSISFLRNLTTLRYVFEPTGRFVIQAISISMLSIVEASPALQILHLSNFNYSYTLVMRLAEAIREKGRQLKEFRVFDTKLVFAKNFSILLWSCAAVERLQIGCRTFARDEAQPFAESLPKLRTWAQEALCSNSMRSHTAQTEAVDKMDRSQDAERTEFAWKALEPGLWLPDPVPEEILEILQRCPNLERMAVPRLSEHDILTKLAPIVTKTMPRLCHLDLSFLNSRPLGILHLVQFCKDLTSLRFGKLKSQSPQLVDAMISGHGHSLQSLDIRTFNKLSSLELNRILTSCRGLKELYASMETYSRERCAARVTPILSTKDMDMVPEKPGWGCKNLETLELCYSGMDTIFGIPEVLRREIGQLPKLKTLGLQRSEVSKGPAVIEKESVRQAVFSWMARLQDLRRLELRGVNAFMDERLIDEVRQQWPQLEWIRYNHD